MNDDPIRDAIHRAVGDSPRPLPFDQLDRHTPSATPRSNRGWLAAVAVVIAIAGVAGVAWVTGRGDETVTPATDPTVAPVPTTEPAPAPPTDPAATTAAPSTDPITTVDTVPDGLFPVADGLDSSTAIAPSGSIDAAPGDLVSLSVDGDLYLHQGAFDPEQYGRTPSAPIRLVDGDDPRVPVEEGPGPNGVSWVGGFVNGALIYGDCCEPVVGNVYALSDAEGPRFNLRYGSAGAADPTGRRWAIADSFGVQVLDFDTGRGSSRSVDASGLELGDVTWSPDATEVWALSSHHMADDAWWQLIRFDADSLTEVGRAQVTDPTAINARGAATFAGSLPDGTVIVAEYAPGGQVRLHGYRPGATEADLPAWAVPDGAGGVRVSPDGSTVAYVLDDTAYLLRAGQSPVEWGTDIAAVWFVTTPEMPLGSATCAEPPQHTPDLWRYADLDGDRISERLIVTTDSPLIWYTTCGSALLVDTLELMRSSGIPMIEPVDINGDGRTELWITSNDGGSNIQPPSIERCGSIYALSAASLIPTTGEHCVGPDSGFACVAVDGVVQPVFYARDGLTLTATLDDGTVLGTHTYAAEQEFAELFDLAC